MSHLNSIQLEQLQEIGSYLHQTRQEQSKPLAEIATATYIPLRLLKAIENAQEEALPQAIFIQGFIRRYGDALGLDGMTLAQRFSTDSSPVATLEKPEPQPIPAPEPPSVPAKPATQQESSTVELPFKPIYGWYLLAGICAIAGLILSTRFFSSPAPQEPTAQQEVPPSPTTEQPPVVDESSTNSPSTPEASPEAIIPKASPEVQATPEPEVPPPQTAPATSAPIAINTDITGESWMRITVDGKVEFEGIAKEGTQQQWAAKEKLTLETGNAGAVMLSVNGEAAKPLGKLGAVEQVTLTPDAARPQFEN
ncbi:helix-turn-helix domain-containing protein [Lusitaniella coriacea LEGE 07157]|uniref:Helix-turn-helix domain-containing protein n=1 Tax=Lusitaniella coriacea LEGE 07157 TaxID=945747 RepID=A0A8J7DU55_9CYAN|nr:RodZ domain-containing protein [Lusitaniella coriacea]MBE9115101.1 helix-turn-helix domain-containing protein [Lusitaniella coriacea LEGE 07157]